MENKLSLNNVKTLSKLHYNKGGDIVVECMNDKEILQWIKEEGTEKQLYQMFNIHNELMEEIIHQKR